MVLPNKSSRPAREQVERERNSALIFLSLIANRECLVDPDQSCPDDGAPVELSERCIVCLTQTFLATVDPEAQQQMIGWLRAIHAHTFIETSRSERRLAVDNRALFAENTDLRRRVAELEADVDTLQGQLYICQKRVEQSDYRAQLTREAGQVWDEADRLAADPWMQIVVRHDPTPVTPQMFAEGMVNPTLMGAERNTELARLRQQAAKVVKERSLTTSAGQLVCGFDWLVVQRMGKGRRGVVLSERARSLLAIDTSVVPQLPDADGLVVRSMPELAQGPAELQPV